MDLRIPRPGRVPADDSELWWSVIENLYWRADLSRGRKRLEATLRQATAGQRALLAIHWWQSEMDNGGFHQFFWNPSGLLIDDVLSGLARVEAQPHAGLLRRALALFPGGRPPAASRLQRTLDAIPPRRFAALDGEFQRLCGRRPTRLDGLCARYVRSNLDEFFLPKGEQTAAAPRRAKAERKAAAGVIAELDALIATIHSGGKAASAAGARARGGRKSSTRRRSRR